MLTHYITCILSLFFQNPQITAFTLLLPPIVLSKTTLKNHYRTCFGEMLYRAFGMLFLSYLIPKRYSIRYMIFTVVRKKNSVIFFFVSIMLLGIFCILFQKNLNGIGFFWKGGLKRYKCNLKFHHSKAPTTILKKSHTQGTDVMSLIAL